MHKLRLDDNDPDDLTEFEELEHIPIDIEASKIHPRYNPETREYDFWMIKLKWETQYFADHVIHLMEDYNGHDLVTMGFGTVDTYGPASNVLQHVPVKNVANDECATKYQEDSKKIYDSMLCAGDIGKDACKVCVVVCFHLFRSLSSVRLIVMSFWSKSHNISYECHCVIFTILGRRRWSSHSSRHETTCRYCFMGQSLC